MAHMQPFERDGLSAAQTKAMVEADEVSVSGGLVLHEVDGTGAVVSTEDITDLLDEDGTEVTYDGWRDIQGAARIVVAQQLNWQRDRIAPYVVVEALGERFRVDLGVYLMSTPTSTSGRDPAFYEVQCYGLGEMLNHPHGETFWAAEGDDPLDVVDDLLAHYQLPSRFTARSDVAPLADDVVVPITDRRTDLWIANYVLAAAGYEPLWFDWDGYARTAPLMAHSEHPTEWEYEAAGRWTMLGEDRSLIRDYFDVPNVLTAIWDSPNAEAVGAIVTLTNPSTGPTSIEARGREVPDTQRFDATDIDALERQARAWFDEAQQVAATVDTPVFVNPFHYHRDRVRLTDTELAVSGRFVVRRWRLPLNGADMVLSLQEAIE